MNNEKLANWIEQLHLVRKICIDRDGIGVRVGILTRVIDDMKREIKQ